MFLVKLPEVDPLACIQNLENHFLLNYGNKLDIADCDMYILRVDKNTKTKQIVLSYKTVFINIFSVVLVNLENGNLVFKHESFNLWETKITSFMNNTT